jgi:hypothetical protein
MHRLLVVLFADLRHPEPQDPGRQLLMADTSDSLRATEHFHLVAVKKSLESAQELATATPALQSALDAYEASVPEARKLRNMREHDWEHMAGRGHHQNEFVRDTAEVQGIIKSRMDGTATRVDSNGYWLGGRHRVETAIEAAQSFLASIEGTEAAARESWRLLR